MVDLLENYNRGESDEWRRAAGEKENTQSFRSCMSLMSELENVFYRSIICWCFFPAFGY